MQIGHLKDKRKCPGCREIDSGKPELRSKCRIKYCDKLNNSKFSYSYYILSSARLRRLDKRYRNKYGMSAFDNLHFIKKNGIRNFIKYEKKDGRKKIKYFVSIIRNTVN